MGKWFGACALLLKSLIYFKNVLCFSALNKRQWDFTDFLVEFNETNGHKNRHRLADRLTDKQTERERQTHTQEGGQAGRRTRKKKTNKDVETTSKKISW